MNGGHFGDNPTPRRCHPMAAAPDALMLVYWVNRDGSGRNNPAT
jgi:hypothetical protein